MRGLFELVPGPGKRQLVSLLLRQTLLDGLYGAIQEIEELFMLLAEADFDVTFDLVMDVELYLGLHVRFGRQSM